MSKIVKNVILYSVLITISLISIFPLLYLFTISIKPSELIFDTTSKFFFTPTFQNYQDIFADGRFIKYLFNSITVGVITVIVATILGMFAAYGFARFKFRSKRILRMASLIPQLIPPITIIVPLFTLFASMKLMDTQRALIISYLTFTMPLSIWLMTGFFEDVPIELEESAMIDGCRRLMVFIRVDLPIVVPGIAATMILSFIYSWNEFLYAVILTGRSARTLPVMITSFMTNKAILWGRIGAAGSLIILPILFFTLFSQKYVIKGLTAGSVKG
ncbi:MAG: carbohydrate ABC transporter permease [Spirochaetes bacterium]|nr:carbohydrate ABC transporter permease [Spirochaetota bacterium]